MPPTLELLAEDYASEEDSDFAPEAAEAAEESSVSDDDNDEEVGDDAEKLKPENRKRTTVDEAEDAGYDNSGDEAIIKKGEKRQKKAKTKDVAGEEETGEGGLIKTRSQRAVEKEKRSAAAASGPVTVDVDALWAQMISEPVIPRTSTAKPDESADAENRDGKKSSSQKPQAGKLKDPNSDCIEIKRTYNFAGKVHTEEKLVARDSAEAKLYLASLGGAGNAPAADGGEAAAEDESSSTTKRMPRKAFRSVFEPITDANSAHRSDLNLSMASRLQAREATGKDKAKKLNTVEKSKMDWAVAVDKMGLKDELELAGKSKDSFAARQDFLARSEMRREEEARRARMAQAGKT
ncbi:bucentaur or craniofacial development-domain-containing protein [Pseudoneurospora amorphoporcata]|uniref:SWR1-complex protein 5 n=1 Tax=Pseudoneurospora amorphoporcata TaxID=241081 RepID=A0AAN6NRJ3_9PEZI|nr:bucentaur or craniofacial development-domain-containing protein [Pseudoneurospora amorphoporcata]